jgi:hypothetical protein
MKFVRNNKTITGRLSDELVMMDIDAGKYFSLNPVATRIWDLLENPLDTNELCSILQNEYDIDAGQCKKDVEDYLVEMVKAGLVKHV